MAQVNKLYQKVLEISEDYLGPAAPRFINRLVSGHLNKPASKITKADLPQLVVWIKLAATVITDDQESVNEYMSRLERLTDSRVLTTAETRVSGSGKSNRTTTSHYMHA